MQRLNGFETGGSTRACTKGIWIWSAPFKLDVNSGEDKLPTDMYLMDCEGSNSLERDASVDSLLTTISILASKILIYNS